MEVRAIARYVRIPPRKARLVINLVRGKPVREAIGILRNLPGKAAAITLKVVQSAAANAENNHRLNPARLRIVRAYVDEGPRWKRIQPKDRGRAFPILKRTSHLTICVEEMPEAREQQKARRKAKTTPHQGGA